MSDKHPCVFCGSTAEKLTKEHLYARWLQPFLFGLHPHRNPRALHWVSSGDGDMATGKLSRAGDMHSQTLKVVCKKCNSGWMADLQEAVKPILIPLLKDEWSVSVEAQATLSAWVAMTAMVREYDNMATVSVPQEDRAFLMDTGSVPEGWAILLGSIQLEGRHPAMNNHFGHTQAYGDKAGTWIKTTHFQSTGFTIGNLMLQTFSYYPSREHMFPVQPEVIAERHDLKLITPSVEPISSAPERVQTLDGFYTVSEYGALALGIRAHRK